VKKQRKCRSRTEIIRRKRVVLLSKRKLPLNVGVSRGRPRKGKGEKIDGESKGVQRQDIALLG